MKGLEFLPNLEDFLENGKIDEADSLFESSIPRLKSRSDEDVIETDDATSLLTDCSDLEDESLTSLGLDDSNSASMDDCSEDAIEAEINVASEKKAKFVFVDMVKKVIILYDKFLFNLPPAFSDDPNFKYSIIQTSIKDAKILEKSFNKIYTNFKLLNDYVYFNECYEKIEYKQTVFIHFPWVSSIKKVVTHTNICQLQVKITYCLFSRVVKLSFFELSQSKVENKTISLPTIDGKRKRYKFKDYNFDHLFIGERRGVIRNFFVNLPTFFKYRNLIKDDQVYDKFSKSLFFKTYTPSVRKCLCKNFNDFFPSQNIKIGKWYLNNFTNFDYYLCYDVETSVSDDHTLQEYMLACCLADDKLEIIDKQCWKKYFQDTLYCDDVVQHFFNYLVDKFENPSDDDFFKCYNVCIFGFNNFKFDDNFILNKLFNDHNYKITYQKRGALVLSCIVENHKLRLVFKDIMAWFPGQSLASATSDFAVEESKMDFNILAFNDLFKQMKYDIDLLPNLDKSNIKNYFKNLRSHLEPKAKAILNMHGGKNLYEICAIYCEQDVVSTFHLFKKLNEAYVKLVDDLKKRFKIEFDFPMNIFNYISPASFAGQLSKVFLNMDNNYQIKFINESISEKIFSTYYGGRVCFGILGEYSSNTNLGYYDITSMYSLAMQANYPTIVCENHTASCMCFKQKIKTGNEINISYLQKRIDESEGKLFNDISFYVLANIYVPEDRTKLISFGLLPERLEDGRISFPIKDFKKRFFNSVQLITCKMFDYKIELLESPDNILFLENKPIFDKLLKELVYYKSQAKIEDNKSFAKLIKCVGSSIYGKFAQKPIAVIYAVNNVLKRSNNYQTTTYQNATHYISSMITSYANFILITVFKELELKFIQDKIPIEKRLGSLLYCDTDSIVFDKDICNFDPNYFNQNEELGYYDFEKRIFVPTWKSKFPKAKRLIVLGKKSYFMLDEKYEFLNKALKGIQTGQFNRITYEVICSIYKDTFSFSFSGLKKNKIKIVDDDDYDGNYNYYPFTQIEAVEDLKKSLSLTALSSLQLKEHVVDEDLKNFKINEKFIKKQTVEHDFFKKILFHYLIFINYNDK